MSEWLGRLRAAWEDLSLRERVLLGAAGGTAALVLVYFALVAPLRSVSERASSGVDAAEQQLEAMERLRGEYLEVAGRLAAVEQRIRDKGQNSNLLTLLESLAETSGVKLESMEERQAGTNDTYGETKVEVALDSVTLTQAVSYLHNIEASPQLLSVKSLRVKTRNDDSDLLDVTFTVSSFEPL